MDLTSFNDFFRDAPASVDVPAIREEWRALGGAYDVEDWQLPLPLWAQRRYNDDGTRAWQTLSRGLSDTSPARPMCIYIHIPFCSSKCGFCDSYSFKLGSHKEEHIERYIARICDELRLWSRVGSLNKHPVSTVHFGGGTPCFAGESALQRLTDCIRENYAVKAETEWALETTVESLTPDMIATLHELGFRRLHIGAQTMEDASRAAIGRRRPSEEVLRATRETRSLGWIVSVDLLCGLPHQTLHGFIDGIERLLDAGVNGFSLYELLIRSQNRRWAESYQLTGRSHLPNYFMMQAGAHLLEARGFRKNLFNHWADEQDKNIYFTFPTRGEDCLAIGAIADGVFGDYHYRHPRYADYLAAPAPGLEGGLRRNAMEARLHPLVTAILSGHLSSSIVREIEKTALSADFIVSKTIPSTDSNVSRRWLQSRETLESAPPLTQRWLEHSLIKKNADGSLVLTTNGAWFAGNMIAELKASF